jgi:hypothetical protein
MALTPDESQQLTTLSQEVTRLNSTVDDLLALMRISGQGGAVDIAVHNNDGAAHAALKASNTETRLSASTATLVTPFGLGYAMQAATLGPGYDLDNLTRVQDLGWWSFNGGNNPANAPAGGQAFLYVTRLSTTSETERVLQMWFGVSSLNSIYVRSRNSSGVWLNWQKMMAATSPGVAKVTAMIQSTGAIGYGDGVVSSSKTATGTYQITHAASTRIAVASAIAVVSNLHATVGQPAGETTVTNVYIRDSSGTLTDCNFVIAIF